MAYVEVSTRPFRPRTAAAGGRRELVAIGAKMPIAQSMGMFERLLASNPEHLRADERIEVN